MGRADALAMAQGIPGLSLMENAGGAVAQAACDLAPPGTAIAVLCGPGNNGGDGFVAARLLRARGYPVRVGLLGHRDALSGDAATMARRWGDPVAPLETALLANAGLVVDALFGAGLSRPLEGIPADVVGAINGAGKPVVAVDVPSGLDGTTGASCGAVVEATCTVTFFRLKPGHVLLPGRVLCGKVRLAEIGIPQSVLGAIGPNTWLNRPAQWREAYPWPKIDGHKYGRGHAVVVSGPAESTGAARLGARGALRVGAGLVTVVGAATATAVNATQLTAIMVKALGADAALSEFLADERHNAVLIGPGTGVGASTAASVATVLASSAATVLDADALTSFAVGESQDATRPSTFGFVARGAEPRPSPQALFSAIKARTAAVVLTPHEGEFKRLFGQLPGSKLERARAAAQMSGAVVILKGPDTVVAAPDGKAVINDNAPPWLATAGSGDVLAGLVTGLLAQRMPAFKAACAAVWLHGECAKRSGVGLIAEDLPEALPQVLRALADGR
ncbi:MAG: NAD(P)H-hydrate dehydratase [Hyphomicrobiaceae bacterium]|nr:NAD(P)H-hydrate dehydratase [Hyphomicrobiaceae bacterium]